MQPWSDLLHGQTGLGKQCWGRIELSQSLAPVPPASFFKTTLPFYSTPPGLPTKEMWSSHWEERLGFWNCLVFSVISEVGGVKARLGDFGRNWTGRLWSVRVWSLQSTTAPPMNAPQNTQSLLFPILLSKRTTEKHCGRLDFLLKLSICKQDICLDLIEICREHHTR